MHYGLSRNGELIIEKRHVLRNSQNREHQKYLWNAIVLREISHYGTSVAKCRGSWVVGRCRGSWVWVNVVGKKSIEKNDKVK